MPHTINADGTATYSLAVPEPLTVTLSADGSYTSGGATYIPSPDSPDDSAWLQLLAGQIAIADERAARADATKRAARDALAAALYNADGGILGPWSVLADTDRAPYQSKADTLGSLGVSAVIA
jgi:hypothetical protein